jgi:DNA-binding transcriptional ArsR family regulator
MVKSQALKLDLIFHALSDSTRRAILYDVSKHEKTVSEIAKPYKISLAAVSKHLNVLENARLIERKKQGSFQIVSLNAESLKTAEEWISYYQQFWGPRLDALKDFLEKRKK